MNIILGSGITALTLLELIPNSIAITMHNDIGGQLNALFQLGPRILHYSREVEEFLNKIGINAKPELFSTSYVIDGKRVSTLTNEQKQAYFNKSRQLYNGFYSSCLNGGKRYILGYDFSKIGLLRILRERNASRIMDLKVITIDEKEQFVTTNKSNSISYDKLYSTLDAEEFFGIMGNGKLDLCNNKKEVVFTLVKRSSRTPEIFNFDRDNFIYFIDDEFINRITFINKEDFVVESNSVLSARWFMDNYLFKERSIVTKSQIIKQLKLSNYGSIELVGRYAQYDHNVKLDNVIERFSK